MRTSPAAQLDTAIESTTFAGADVEYTVMIRPIFTADGNITINIPTNVVRDRAGNENEVASSPRTVPFTPPLSNDKTLSALSLLADTLVVLDPVFDPLRTVYTAGVANNVTSLTVTPTTADGDAGVTVDTVAVNSDEASDAITLKVGDTNIAIEVTAADGSTGTYRVTVTRAGPLTDFSLSTESNTNIDLSTAFASSTTSYTANVDNDVSDIQAAITTEAGSTMTAILNRMEFDTTVGATSPLVVGENELVITIDATAYRIIITRAGLTSGPALESLDNQSYDVNKPITALTLPEATDGTSVYAYRLTSCPLGLHLIPVPAPSRVHPKRQGLPLCSISPQMIAALLSRLSLEL